MRIVHIHSVLQKDGHIEFQYGLEFVDLDKTVQMDSARKSYSWSVSFFGEEKEEEGMRASH